jgi:cold-inducible RNA-binding protein
MRSTILKSSGSQPKLLVQEEKMAQKLFVGNLPRGTNEDVLSDFVSSSGIQVMSAVVIRDRITGQSRGFGFVELAETEDLRRAIQRLDGQPLDGRQLTVNEARPQRTGFSRSQGASGGRYHQRRDY